ncbi:hypothetical protein PAECIP111893_04693 [Paenibacillus plantiphilus]|uniref:Uncharacterized protein n=1 Tax=Paenibacillus plantiphilus TaxID=2905650 RepID=A0ABM9CSA7_9BACL|nr:hypothetical protein PAECIP111893_04693 [Paenibacillus plantiphilus]
MDEQQLKDFLWRVSYSGQQRNKLLLVQIHVRVAHAVLLLKEWSAANPDD